MDRCIEHMDRLDSMESRYVSDSVTNSLSVAGRQSILWFFDQIFSFKRPSTYQQLLCLSLISALRNPTSSFDVAFFMFSCTGSDTDVADNVASSNAVEGYLGSYFIRAHSFLFQQWDVCVCVLRRCTLRHSFSSFLFLFSILLVEDCYNFRCHA